MNVSIIMPGQRYISMSFILLLSNLYFYTKYNNYDIQVVSSEMTHNSSQSIYRCMCVYSMFFSLFL